SDRNFRRQSNGRLRSLKSSRELVSGHQRAFSSLDPRAAGRQCWRELLLLRARLTSSRSRVPSSSASGLENQRRASARSLGKVAALPHPLFSLTSSTRLLPREEWAPMTAGLLST